MIVTVRLFDLYVINFSRWRRSRGGEQTPCAHGASTMHQGLHTFEFCSVSIILQGGYYSCVANAQILRVVLSLEEAGVVSLQVATHPSGHMLFQKMAEHTHICVMLT